MWCRKDLLTSRAGRQGNLWRVFLLLCWVSACKTVSGDEYNPSAASDADLQEGVTLVDDFGASSCLRSSNGNFQASPDGHELVLTLNTENQSIRTATQLSYGKYTLKMRSDVGAGSVIAFYLMGVDDKYRNDPDYIEFHDEIDIELINTLYSEKELMATNVNWFNVYSNHVTLVQAKNPTDAGGGSLLAADQVINKDPDALKRIITPELRGSDKLTGFNYNDGKDKLYTIDYRRESITFAIKDLESGDLRSHTINRKPGQSWPDAKMYLAISLWASVDPAVIDNFTGKLDEQFSRPMRVYIDKITYTPAPYAKLPELATWNGQLPWQNCGYQ